MTDQRMDFLAALEYPGRLICVGADATAVRTVLIYAITGRSPSSQARKLVLADNGVWVRPTDEKTLREGNPDLLVYPAVLFHPAGLAVSNGKQTEDILREMESGRPPVSVLASALARWSFEPDAPIFTPRISGCVLAGTSALSVVRRGDDGVDLKSYFEIPIVPNRLHMISTYAGPNRNPVPAFSGEPKSSRGWDGSCRETAEAVFESLGPASREKDFRVAVVCVFASRARPTEREVHIINRHERIG